MANKKKSKKKSKRVMSKKEEEEMLNMHSKKLGKNANVSNTAKKKAKKKK